jgi:predicted nucleotidyltransferase
LSFPRRRESKNNDIASFISNKSKEPDVLCIILFGSRARGTNRADSDVDLLIIRKEGFARVVEKLGNTHFEITYTTSSSCVEFWHDNKDDCFNLFQNYKVLFNRNNTFEELKKAGDAIIAEGKTLLSESEKDHLRFDITDQISACEALLLSDSCTAELIVADLVWRMSEIYFDVRRFWIPAPKQRLSVIHEIEPQVYDLFKKALTAPNTKSKLDYLDQLSKAVFQE